MYCMIYQFFVYMAVQKMVLYGVMYLYIGQWDCNDVTVLGDNLFLIFA